MKFHRASRLRGCLWMMRTLCLVAVAFAVMPVVACVQTEPEKAVQKADEVDLVDRVPFDRIILDAFNRNETLDILPLLRPPSKPFPERDVLVFELADESGIELEVPFENVVDFKTFNQLLMDEAEELLKSENYSRAFRNLLHVNDHAGSSPELTARITNVLFLDAKKNYETGEYGLALSMFEDVYERDPRFSIEGISLTSLDLILDCYDRVLINLESKEYWSEMRGLIQSVAVKYPGDASSPLVEPWSKKMVAITEKFQADSLSARSAKDFLMARVLAGKAIQVSPDDATCQQLMDDTIAAFPMLFVGVSQPAMNPDPQRIDDWASRRVGRLTQRRLMELSGFTDEGGRYLFPNGKFIQMDELGLIYHFVLDEAGSAEAVFGVPPLTPHELAALLLAHADPSVPGYHVPWARIVDRISVPDDKTVEIRLRVPFVRPEALLQLPYVAPGREPDKNGPYVIADQNSDRSLFRINDRYTQLPGQQYPEIVEWSYGDPSTAVEALIRGVVDVVDRIPPGELKRLKETPGIEVRSYTVPTMHMLVPNLRNDFMKQAMFRIGLLRTIDREQIIREQICRGLEIDGSVVVDSPFPVGTEDNDQIAYAVDITIKPAANNYLLGQLLVQGEKRRQEDALVRKGEEHPVVPIPEIVLAYPRNEMAAIACNAIASQWRQVGVKTRLRVLDVGATRPPDDDYDFLYLELACTEPLSDADFLFGMNGFVPDVNATIEQIVRKVNTASSWRLASSNLRMMHRQVLNSVAVLPLYQLREHFAFRSNVRGIGRDLIFLYQQVDRWNVGSSDGSDR